MISGYRDSDYAAIMNELCPELKGTAAGRRSMQNGFLYCETL
jgi:hypothetical protein